MGGYFRNDADHRDFTAIGTAAGMHPCCQPGAVLLHVCLGKDQQHLPCCHAHEVPRAILHIFHTPRLAEVMVTGLNSSLLKPMT